MRTVNRGEVGRGNGGKRGKNCQGTCIKNPWTKPKWGRIEGGLWGGLGWGGVVGEKWRQLYLNFNKKKFLIKKDKMLIVVWAGVCHHMCRGQGHRRTFEEHGDSR